MITINKGQLMEVIKGKETTIFYTNTGLHYVINKIGKKYEIYFYFYNTITCSTVKTKVELVSATELRKRIYGKKFYTENE